MAVSAHASWSPFRVGSRDASKDNRRAIRRAGVVFLAGIGDPGLVIAGSALEDIGRR
jgi:hypothetical protein